MNSRLNKMNVRAGLVMAMILSFMFLPTFDADATHIVGGQLSYDIVGFERAEFTLVVRRDCALGDPEADYDDPAYLRVFDLDGNPVLNPIYGFINGRIEIALNPSDTLRESLTTGCETLGSEVCVQEATYRITKNMVPHPSGGYIIAYQRCCRNSSLTNVLDPLGTGMTSVTVVTNEAITSRNRTPELPNFPPIYACIGVPFDVPQGAVNGDPDGDELRYRLNTPNVGATMTEPYPVNASPPPYDPVEWAPPYSLADLLGNGTNLAIDPVTGEITVTPQTEGQFLVSFCVEEYRNDRLFNTTCREFEVNTRPCGDPAVAIIDDLPMIQCDDFEIIFSSEGSVGDSFAWDFGDESPINNMENPTHTYDTGCYTIYLTVTNTESGCYDIDSAMICLYNSGVVPDFDISMLECTDSIVVLVEDASSYDPDNPLVEIDYEVTIGGLPVASDSGSSIQFTLLENANVTICQNIKVENGCIVENCQTVELNLLDLVFDQDVVLCLEEESEILISHAQGDDITVVWLPNDIIVSDLNANPITVLTPDSLVTTLYFTATNEFGCSNSDSINVTTAGKRPDLSFNVTQDCGSLKITLDNTSVDSFDVAWDFGDGNSSTEWAPMHTYAAAGTYTITLTGGIFPCDASYSVTIDVPIETIEFPDTVYQCFNDSLTLNPGGNTTWDYVWTPTELFAQSTAASPNVLVTETTTVYVMVTVFEGDNFCVHLDSIVVVPVPDFQFDVDPAEDVTVCDSDANSILMTVQTDEGVEITWKDINGTILHTGDTFNAPLVDGLNQFVVMGVYMGITECMKTETINVTLDNISVSLNIINVEDGSDMFCEPAEGKLIVTVDGPPGNYTYEWSPLDGVITGADNDSLCLMVDQSRTYCVTVTNTDLNCSAEGCYTIEFGAEVSVVLLDSDGIICAGDQVKLVASIVPEGNDCSYSWDVPGTTVGPTDQDTICFIASGSGRATVSVGCVGGCTDTASVTITLRDLNALITATADPDQVNNPNDIIQLDAVGGDPAWTYSWDGPGIIPPSDIKNPTAMPGLLDPPPTYTVMVIDNFGCEGESSVTLRQPDVNPCENPYVYIPNAFSPNGGADPRNEIIKINGVQIDKFFSFIIYNRWGQEVKKFTDLNDSWDGTYKGDPLEADVYGYYLHVGCINGQESIQQGNISLLR